MTGTKGREHVFLGMNMKFNDNGTANIGMKEHGMVNEIFGTPRLQSKK